MSGGIHRAPRVGNYDIFQRDTVRDSSLSYRARGILMRLLSNSDGFSMTSNDLAKEGKEGRDSILSALKELRDTGYLVTKRFQNAQGKWATENIVFDLPQKTPSPEKPTSVSQTPVFQDLKAGKAASEKAAAAATAENVAQTKIKSNSLAGKKSFFKQKEFGEIDLENENERDLIIAKSLVENWGLEKINETVSTLAASGKRGFPSNITKILGAPPPKNPYRSLDQYNKKMFGGDGKFYFISIQEKKCLVEIWGTQERSNPSNLKLTLIDLKECAPIFKKIDGGELQEVRK